MEYFAIMEIKTQKGSPFPLGATVYPTGINFSVVVDDSNPLKINIFQLTNEKKIASVCEFPIQAKTGKVGHIFIEGIAPYMLYRYQNEKGIPRIDPYAKEVYTGTAWRSFDKYDGYGVILPYNDFNWENDAHLNLPLKDLVIYEMHIRGFTNDPSSQTSKPGTYLGVIEKIPYLKKLGVNAVEFLPIAEFNEKEQHGDREVINYWGYNSLNFFSPMSRFASEPNPGTPTNEFKTLVKELHRNGIEVILDVVFNHTDEGNQQGPTYSFRGFSETSYYMIDENHNYMDFTGCGNTLKSNFPVSLDLIIDALRYWVSEMHVDGFRFDLASALTRGNKGEPLQSPPVIQAMNGDPVLSSVKLIAEPWDAGGLYHVGHFPENDGKWAEWNGVYRDTVRNFIKGTGSKGDFVTRICGSQDLYGKDRKPYHSVNFVTVHDGFSLNDLVSYNSKHNEKNGENNQDGSNDNLSWNCGKEGVTTNVKIIELRKRQKKNFMLALLISQGVPMFPMGDEYGHTKLGNNNTWCQDNALNWLQWSQISQNISLFSFVAFLIEFRKNNPILRQENFLTDQDIQWFGLDGNPLAWNDGLSFIACVLHDKEKKESIYIAFNANQKKNTIVFPNPPEGRQWNWVVNTGIEPSFFSEPKPIQNPKCIIRSYSSIMLKLGVLIFEHS